MLYMRGYFGVGLCLPRDPANVGCALRACGCFGAAFAAYSGRRYTKHAADTQRADRHMPLFHAGNEPCDILKQLPANCTPVAVELFPGAVPLTEYVHPERAFYIFGPEDGSLPDSLVAKCEHKVRIPSKYCLNLAAAVNIVLYDRTAKRTPNRTTFENGCEVA